MDRIRLPVNTVDLIQMEWHARGCRFKSCTAQASLSEIQRSECAHTIWWRFGNERAQGSLPRADGLPHLAKKRDVCQVGSTWLQYWIRHDD